MERPFVFINVAMTLDGKIDTFEHKGAAISSQSDRERVESDAVMKSVCGTINMSSGT